MSKRRGSGFLPSPAIKDVIYRCIMCMAPYNYKSGGHYFRKLSDKTVELIQRGRYAWNTRLENFDIGHNVPVAGHRWQRVEEWNW